MDRPIKFYVCALCFVIGVTLCVRSYWQEEGFIVRKGPAYAGIATHRGGVYCYWFTEDGTQLPMIRGRMRLFSQSIIKDYGNQTVDRPDLNVLGFTYQDHLGTWAGKIVSVPFWFLLLGAGVGGALWRRKRFGPGLCAACGYDLRATPGRCPECGAISTAERNLGGEKGVGKRGHH